MQESKGFTLIEFILSIALISVIAGASIPVYQLFQNRNELDVAQNIIVQSLHRAQTLSWAIDGDTSWGVSIQSGTITLFQGTSFATRDTSKDELFDMPSTITPSGLSEVVFTKFTGEPQSMGIITFTSLNNETRVITINSKGTIL